MHSKGGPEMLKDKAAYNKIFKIEICLSKIELKYVFSALDLLMNDCENNDHGYHVPNIEDIVHKLSRAERIAMDMPMATSP
jgi:hypothetical protein